MLDVKIKGTDIRFQLPERWNETTLGVALDFLQSDDEPSMLAAFAKTDKETIRRAHGVDIGSIRKCLGFMANFPKDFLTGKPHKTIELNGVEVNVPKNISVHLDYGNKMDVESYWLELESKNEKPNFLNSAEFLLSVVFFKDITGRVLEDVTELDEVSDTIRSVPAIKAFQIANFFLNSLSKQKQSGNVVYKKLPDEQKQTKPLTMLQKALYYIRPFRNISHYKPLEEQKTE